MKVNGLILAAGNSSRLGQPKQLLKFQGRTLLADIEAKLLNCCDQVFVVLGYRPELFRQELSDAEIIINSDWQVGMGNSMTCGVKLAKQQTDGVLIALSDQPLIDAQHYQQLVDQFNQTPNQIIATAYQNQCGVPAIFPDNYFHHLTQLDAKTGAQCVIRNFRSQVKQIACQAASYDVDTADDWHTLNTIGTSTS